MDNQETELDTKRIRPKILGAIHNPDQWPRVIDVITGCKYYAYIFHDHDEGKEKHLHFCVEERHNLNVWSEMLGIPINMIELPKKSWRVCNRYLIHLDHPEKFLYNPSDVITNKPMRFKSFLDDNTEISPKVMYFDLKKVKEGKLTCEDFIEKYEYHIFKLSFYSQFRIYKELFDYDKC